MNGQEIVSSLTSAAIVVYVIQWLKATKAFGWISAETTTINRLASSLGALIGAFGIHFTYDAQVGALTVTGLTFAAIAHGAWHWLNQFAAQQVLYDAITNNAKATTVSISSLPSTSKGL